MSATAATRREPLRRSSDPLGEAVARFLRRPAAPANPAGPSVEAAVAGLAQRLDDKGCATGRVTAARLDELSRAFDRLETKLNAILLAVTATFLSTLLGTVTATLRAHGALP